MPATVKMAETAVGFVIDYLTTLVAEEARLLKGVRSQVLGIKRELESIQCFLKEADMRMESEVHTSTSSTTRGGVTLWVKQLRDVSFRIEDVIDEYFFYLAQHPRHESGFINCLYKFSGCLFKLKQQHCIASQIQYLKAEVSEIKHTSKIYSFQSTGERSTTTSDSISRYDPRKAAMYLEESDIVGIESPRDELISWLLDDQQSQRTVISVVGMGGLGKTTLAKKVYDSVKGKFDCHAWIVVSQSYQREELLRNVVKKFCEGNNEPIPEGIDSMDEEALINKLRDYLQNKRYVIIFDDVWDVHFWGDIEHAIFDNNHGGRILITTRNMGVAEFCKISSFLYVHKMQPLPPKKALELFCNRVFKFENGGGQFPTDLLKLSDKIVNKLHGVPLAIVAMAGLLSTKRKSIDEWTRLHDSLSSELESNPHLISIKKILSLSYSDLPHHLKSCFMYFGMYPEDYSIRGSRIIRQWIVEGFVNKKKNKTLEEVAYEYLTELINRSLVQLSNSDDQFTGKADECHIHDLMREVILKKMEDSSFCHVLTGNDEYNLREELITRRLSIANTSLDVLPRFDQISQVRTIINFNIAGKKSLDISTLRTLIKNFRLLKVLDFEDAPIEFVPEEIGNLFHLRYLSFRNTKVKKLPKCIGKLVNLEILDLNQSLVFEIPTEINMLRKLRHLYGHHCDYALNFCLSSIKGIKVQAGIGSLESLQGLRVVELDEVDVEVIKELGNLTQLRKLGIHKLRRQDGKVVCESIEKMKHLQSLLVIAYSEDDVIDLDYMLSPPQYLKRLYLFGRCLRKLPEWITKLRCLARLRISWSKLEDDQVKTLKTLHNLVELTISYEAYVGERLQFEKGVFPNLKFLNLTFLSGLKSLMIEEGALANLEKLFLGPSPLMKEVFSASGIQHLKNLKYLGLQCMPNEFINALRPHGQLHQIVEHIPVISIADQLQGGKFDFTSL